MILLDLSAYRSFPA